MAMIPTGLIAGLGGLARTAAGSLGSVASKLLPYANLALTGYGAYSAAKTVGKAAMPGGAPIFGGGLVPYSGSSMFPLPTPGSPYGGIGEPGGFFGGSTQVVPTRVAGGLRLPSQVMVPSPSNPSLMRTYVLAPMVKYKVSIARRGRRCRPGR